MLPLHFTSSVLHLWPIFILFSRKILFWVVSFWPRGNKTLWCFRRQFLTLFLFGVVYGPLEVHTWTAPNTASVNASFWFWRHSCKWRRDRASVLYSKKIVLGFPSLFVFETAVKSGQLLLLRRFCQTMCPLWPSSGYTSWEQGCFNVNLNVQMLSS